MCVFSRTMQTILEDGARFSSAGFGWAVVAGTAPSQGQKMSFADDFNGVAGADAGTRLLESYFVLDVTNPEKVPTLLWSFSDQNLGFTTSYPAVARVSPLGDLKADNTNAQWFMVVGSGATSYDAGVGQTGKMFAVNIKDRMTSTAAGVVTMFDASGGGATPPNSFVGDMSLVRPRLRLPSRCHIRGENHQRGTMGREAHPSHDRMLENFFAGL